MCLSGSLYRLKANAGPDAKLTLPTNSLTLNANNSWAYNGVKSYYWFHVAKQAAHWEIPHRLVRIHMLSIFL